MLFSCAKRVLRRKTLSKFLKKLQPQFDSIKSMRLRLCVFNVENLFVLVDEPNESRIKSIIDHDSEQEWQSISVSTIPNKALRLIKGVARAIQEMRPDILFLCEVGGLESLRNFSKYFLNGEYVPYLIEGNSDRGIDLGYLVRAGLPFKYDLISHKHRSIDFLYPHERQSLQTGYADDRLKAQPTHKFSRDVLELRVFSIGSEKPSLVCLLVHLKSQLDKDRIDPLGRDRRKAELEKLVKIYLEIEQENGGVVPIAVGGDFNGSPSGQLKDPEFAALSAHTKLKEVLEVAGVAEEERFTHMQIQPWGNKSVNRQFDCLFVNPVLQPNVIGGETKVFRFSDEFGMKVDIPRSLAEKRLLPSDHYPVITEVQIEEKK